MATLRQTFSDIASAIRAKGVSGTMKPIDMAQKIGEIRSLDGYGYLTFTAQSSTTLTLKQNGSISPHKLLKSTDGVNWVKWDNPATNGIVLNVGQSVYIKADEDALNRTATSEYDYNQFSYTGRISCGGDIRSIVKLNAPDYYNYWLYGLFQNCKSLTQSPELPSTTLADYCYRNMFYNCTSLTTAPIILPATTMAEQCYWGMFGGCTSLKTAPELPATTLAQYCYDRMFYNCKSLTRPPELPATNLANYCYEQMFNGCTSLTSAPELPATTLATSCYTYMFNGCTSLTSAPELPATTLVDYCYSNMFSGCTSLTYAPELPATTLKTYCYSSMFKGCTSLKRIKMNASSGNFGFNMLDGCKSLELVDMTGSTGVPTLSSTSNFANTNDTYKIVVPDSLYDTWIAATNWASIASHIMKKSDWNAAHPDDILGQ